MVIAAAHWRQPGSHAVGLARYIGRAKYHAARQEVATRRRAEVYDRLLMYGWDAPGVLGLIAAELGVSCSTVCRDRQALAR